MNNFCIGGVIGLDSTSCCYVLNGRLTFWNYIQLSGFLCYLRSIHGKARRLGQAYSFAESLTGQAFIGILPQ